MQYHENVGSDFRENEECDRWTPTQACASVFFGNGPTHPTLCSAHTRGVPMMQFTISSVVSIQIENLSTIGSQMGMNGAVWNLHWRTRKQWETCGYDFSYSK